MSRETIRIDKNGYCQHIDSPKDCDCWQRILAAMHKMGAIEIERLTERNRVDVFEIETVDGRLFYSAAEISDGAIALLLKRSQWRRIERIWMFEDDYRAIPATQDACELFRNIHETEVKRRI